MSRFDFGSIDASIETGTSLGVILDSFRDALLTLHKGGSTTPAYAQAGMIWIDDAVATAWKVKIYVSPGVGSVTIATINSSTGEVQFAITASQIAFDNSGSGLSATNVQAALTELGINKANKASPTFTGTVTMDGEVDIVDGRHINYLDGSTRTFRCGMSGTNYLEQRFVSASWYNSYLVDSVGRYRMYSVNVAQVQTTSSKLEVLVAPEFIQGLDITSANGIRLYGTTSGYYGQLSVSQAPGDERIQLWSRSSQTEGAYMFLTGDGNSGVGGISTVTFGTDTTETALSVSAAEVYSTRDIHTTKDFQADLT